MLISFCDATTANAATAQSAAGKSGTSDTETKNGVRQAQHLPKRMQEKLYFIAPLSSCPKQKDRILYTRRQSAVSKCQAASEQGMTANPDLCMT